MRRREGRVKYMAIYRTHLIPGIDDLNLIKIFQYDDLVYFFKEFEMKDRLSLFFF